MTNIEDKLNNLPRVQLSKSVDRKLKIKLYGKIARREMSRAGSFAYLNRRSLVASAVALLMLFVVATPSYAYASRNVTIGHFLFPVKKAIENIEYKVSTDKSATLLKFSLRRIEEARLIAGDISQEANITILMKEARKLREDAGLSEDKPSSEAIVEYQKKGDAVIKQVAEKIGLDSGDEVTDAVALTIEDVNKNEKANEKPDVQKQPDEKPVIKSNPQAVPSPQPPKNKKAKPVVPPANKKEDVIVNLKNEVKKLETTLTNDDYKKEDVKRIVEKLNGRIEKAEQEQNNEKSDQIINPTKALTNNVEYFVKKENRGNASDAEQDPGNRGGQKQKNK